MIVRRTIDDCVYNARYTFIEQPSSIRISNIFPLWARSFKCNVLQHVYTYYVMWRMYICVVSRMPVVMMVRRVAIPRSIRHKPQDTHTYATIHMCAHT